MKRQKIFTLIHLVVLLVLEIIPYGAVCNFADEGGEIIRKTYSYFSLVPYGYANFGPFATAVLTVILLVLCTVNLVKQTATVTKLTSALSAFALFFSVLPLTLGFSYWTVSGICITAILARVTMLKVTVVEPYKV